MIRPLIGKDIKLLWKFDGEKLQPRQMCLRKSSVYISCMKLGDHLFSPILFNLKTVKSQIQGGIYSVKINRPLSRSDHLYISLCVTTDSITGQDGGMKEF